MGSAHYLIRILTVDDHPLLRKGIAALVNAEADLKLVAEASNGKESIDAFRSHRPDVTLMDLPMNGMDGLEAINAISEGVSRGSDHRSDDLQWRHASAAGP
jgi:DNA-binding NarL/FixJ family response regulator